MNSYKAKVQCPGKKQLRLGKITTCIEIPGDEKVDKISNEPLSQIALIIQIK